MALALLLSAFLAGLNAWAIEALRVHAPALGGWEGVPSLLTPGRLDPSIIADWTALTRIVPKSQTTGDQCDVFKRPEAIPRASVDPLTDDDFARLPVSGLPDTGFQSFFNKLQSGGSVKILTLGGSVTAGVKCNGTSPDPDYQCAWPARVQSSLAELFPQSSISSLNMAIGGTTTSVFLGAIGLLLRDVPGGPAQIDMIMVDTLVNDAEVPAEGRGGLSQSEYIKATFEALVRVLHEMAPQASVVPVFAGCRKCLAAAAEQRAVASFYGLPTVDYAGLVARRIEEVPDLWHTRSSVDDIHIIWLSHQIVADVVVGTWAKTFRELCAGASLRKPTFPPGTLVSPHLLGLFETCKVGRSEYYARKQGGLQPTIVRGWRLFEDRPGKPGWISEEPGAVLKFRLAFGANPKLLFTFLRTYENIGWVMLEMLNGTVGLDGLDTKNRVSQSHTEWLASKQLKIAFGMEPKSQVQVVDLTVTAPEAKFKIISVVSC